MKKSQNPVEKNWKDQYISNDSIRYSFLPKAKITIRNYRVETMIYDSPEFLRFGIEQTVTNGRGFCEDVRMNAEIEEKDLFTYLSNRDKIVQARVDALRDVKEFYLINRLNESEKLLWKTFDVADKAGDKILEYRKMIDKHNKEMIGEFGIKNVIPSDSKEEGK